MHKLWRDSKLLLNAKPECHYSTICLLLAIIASWHLFILIRGAVLIKREGRQGQNDWGGRKWKRGAVMWGLWSEREALLSLWWKWFHLPAGTNLGNCFPVIKAQGYLWDHIHRFWGCPLGSNGNRTSWFTNGSSYFVRNKIIDKAGQIPEWWSQKN